MLIAASVSAFLLVAFVLVPLGWWVYLNSILPRYEAEREQRSFAAAIRQVAPEPQFILFFRAEAHALAFHIGGIQNTFPEWENLDTWAGRAGTYYLVMPPECAAEWSRYVTAGRLVEVLRNTDFTGGQHEEPLVLMRTAHDNKPSAPGRP